MMLVAPPFFGIMPKRGGGNCGSKKVVLVSFPDGRGQDENEGLQRHSN